MREIPRASIRELAHKIKGYGTPRFAFFLGAGASKQSGIPIANDMIRHFKEQLVLRCCPEDLKTDEEKSAWLGEQDWYRGERSEYCKLFERFEPKEIGRQRYIESIIENRAPSFGYVVLANLMAVGHINTIITTNFDDLIYSSCTTFTGIRPIVYAYGVLASEMRLTAQRPKILKLHGDYLYSALKNTSSETARQDANMERQLRQVLSEYGLIVVGYGGGDESVMKVLADISERNDLYWCVRRGERVNEAVENLLRDKRGFLVEVEGFDEMMNEVRRVVEFDVKKMIGSIEERRNQIINYLEKFESQYSVEILGEIVETIKEPDKKGDENTRIVALDFLTRAYKAQQANELLEAESLYRRAIEVDPNYATAYYNLGTALSSLKRYAEAEAAYRKAIEIDPQDVGGYNNLGYLLTDLKRHEEAEALLRRAAELEPNSAVVCNNLGNALNGLKRYAEAESLYRKAIEIDANYATAYNNLGTALNGQKRYAEAEAAYRKAMEINPALALAYSNLGHLLNELRRYAEAEALLRKAVELEPDAEPHAYSNLSNALRSLNREAEALTFAERAHRLAPASPHYLLALASLYKKLGRDEEAGRHAEQARRLLPPTDWYNLACLESIGGNPDGAIDNLERAVERNDVSLEWARRDPDFEWMRNDPRFIELVGAESVSDGGT
jgi:tetratricopeptide (TPR) repeat protein